MKRTAIEALDNLHRCALCHRAKDPKGWLKHCREMRDIVEAELRALEPVKERVVAMRRSACETTDSITIYLSKGLDDGEYERFAEVMDATEEPEP